MWSRTQGSGCLAQVSDSRGTSSKLAMRPVPAAAQGRLKPLSCGSAQRDVQAAAWRLQTRCHGTQR